MKRILFVLALVVCALSAVTAQSQQADSIVAGGKSWDAVQEAVEHSLANAGGLDSEDKVDIVAIVVVFFTPILLLLVAKLFSYLKLRRHYDVMMKAIEKGMVLPKEFFEADVPKKTPLQKGLQQILVGCVLVIALWITLDWELAIWGLLVVALGVGNILSHFLGKKEKTG